MQCQVPKIAENGIYKLNAQLCGCTRVTGVCLLITSLIETQNI